MVPVRLGAIGDWHVPEGPRFADTVACIRFAIQDGAAQGVQLWINTGDMTGTTVPHESTILERNTVDELLLAQARQAPVIVVKGNHDAEGDLDGYARLAGAHPIFVVTEPRVLDIAGVRVFCLPYLLKRVWAARLTGTIEETDRGVEDLVAQLFGSWRPLVEQARAQGLRTILVHHAVVRNCLVAGGEQLKPGQEIELSVETIQSIGVDFCVGGHIHTGQEMAPGIWFAPTPSRSNFGETDEKGYLIADVASGRPPIVHRRATPARRFVTRELVWTPDGARTPEGALPAFDDVDGAEVKIALTIPEALAATAQREELKAAVRAAGAVDVVLDPRIEPITRVRSAEILAAQTLEEELDAYWNTLGEGAPDEAQRARCRALLTELEAQLARGA